MSNKQMLLLMLWTAFSMGICLLVGYRIGTQHLVLEIPQGGSASGDGAYTPHLHLYLPHAGEKDWDKPIDDDFRRIDDYLATGKVSEPTNYVPEPALPCADKDCRTAPTAP